MTTIKNLENYNTEMRKSLIDKIFFLDKVNANTFIDFGCADGSMLKLAHQILPSYNYVGYDLSQDMIDKCNCDDIKFTSNYEELNSIISENKLVGNKMCISLISLIHEIYAYGADIKSFWNFIFNTGFDYIAIRDLCISRTANRASDFVSVAKIRMNYDKHKIAQWESTWGNLSDNTSLIHFLLKYRFSENWDRELVENYLPIYLEDLFALIPNTYEPIYIEHYTLPFTREQIKIDFNIDLQEKTHLKLILKRK